jgi:hypothetical protein
VKKNDCIFCCLLVGSTGLQLPTQLLTQLCEVVDWTKSQFVLSSIVSEKVAYDLARHYEFRISLIIGGEVVALKIKFAHLKKIGQDFVGVVFWICSCEWLVFEKNDSFFSVGWK